MKMIKNIINKIGSPKIFVYTNIWLIILVFIGTIAQKDLGLYLVQKEYFYPWITWLGILPSKCKVGNGSFDYKLIMLFYKAWYLEIEKNWYYNNTLWSNVDSNWKWFNILF